jgi:hypothetical protein
MKRILLDECISAGSVRGVTTLIMEEPKKRVTPYSALSTIHLSHPKD